MELNFYSFDGGFKDNQSKDLEQSGGNGNEILDQTGGIQIIRRYRKLGYTKTKTKYNSF